MVQNNQIYIKFESHIIKDKQNNLLCSNHKLFLRKNKNMDENRKPSIKEWQRTPIAIVLRQIISILILLTKIY